MNDIVNNSFGHPINPIKVAFADDTKAVTWKALNEKSSRMAIHLKKIGVRYGDFFVLQMVNVIEFFFLFFGLNRIGAVPVMCLPRHRKIEINHVIGLHRARGICVMGAEKFDFVEMVEQILEVVEEVTLKIITQHLQQNQ